LSPILRSTSSSDLPLIAAPLSAPVSCVPKDCDSAPRLCRARSNGAVSAMIGTLTSSAIHSLRICPCRGTAASAFATHPAPTRHPRSTRVRSRRRKAPAGSWPRNREAKAATARKRRPSPPAREKRHVCPLRPLRVCLTARLFRHAKRHGQKIGNDAREAYRSVLALHHEHLRIGQ